MQLLFKPIGRDTQKQKGQSSSRVRDHLANERTYLAWMRTAITMIGFSIVIVRLCTFHQSLLPHPSNGWTLGLLFSLVGLITVIFSTRNYFSVCRDIDEDTYEPGDRWVILFSLTVILLGAGIIYFFVFAVPLSPISFLER